MSQPGNCKWPQCQVNAQNNDELCNWHRNKHNLSMHEQQSNNNNNHHQKQQRSKRRNNNKNQQQHHRSTQPNNNNNNNNQQHQHHRPPQQQQQSTQRNNNNNQQQHQHHRPQQQRSTQRNNNNNNNNNDNQHQYHRPPQQQENWGNQSTQSLNDQRYRPSLDGNNNQRQQRGQSVPCIRPTYNNNQSPRDDHEYINYDKDENLWTNKEPDLWVIIESFLDRWYSKFVQDRLDNAALCNIITDLRKIRPNMKCCCKCSHPSITNGLRYGHLVRQCPLDAYSIPNQFALLGSLHFYWKGYGGPDKLITFFDAMRRNLTFFSCYLVDKAWHLAINIPQDGKKKSMLYIFILYLRIFAYYHIYT